MKKDELYDLDDHFCGRCKEEFPVATAKENLIMGLLMPISRITNKKIRKEFSEWYYICGSCVFDLTDMEYEEKGGE